MMLSNIFPLFAAGLIGIYSKDVSKLSVKTGGFISIPCPYESQYVPNVKYLCRCKWPLWRPCDQVMTATDQPSTSESEKYSIFDDKHQHVFTVTIRDLNIDDTCYLCGVSKPWWDVTHKISLSVTKGVPRLYVEQQNITAVTGGSVTVMCRYNKPNQFKWCTFGGTCIEAQDGVMNSAAVTVNKSIPDVAIVTMSELKKEGAGWYFCENGGLQMPVYITVSKEVSTASTPIPPHLTGMTHSSTVEPHASIFTNQPNTGLPINSSLTETEGDNLWQEQKNSTKQIVITTSLLLLMLIISGVTWKIKRCYMTTPQESAAKQSREPEECVIYSTIVIQGGAQEKTGPAAGSVVYSTVCK